MTDHQQMLAVNEAKWDEVAPLSYGGTALPEYGPLTPTEESLRLLPEMAGKSALCVGCGSGHSLLYLAGRGATDLWGIDISSAQIDYATELFARASIPVHLIQSPMEVNPGLPLGHFDLVIAIYSLGWTVDLPRTLGLIASYLKPGGVFVFSWEHPIYGCMAYENGAFVFDRSYLNESTDERVSWKGASPVVMHPRKLSTYLNELITAGLTIDGVVEPSLELPPNKPAEKYLAPDRWYSIPRAELVPTTFIVRAHK